LAIFASIIARRPWSVRSRIVFQSANPVVNIHKGTNNQRHFIILRRTLNRSFQLRGLRWSDVDLKAAVLHVRQRADRYSTIGNPKSKAGHRAVPLAPQVVQALREWKLQCPKGTGLVFPAVSGEDVALHNNTVRAFTVAVRAAGVVDKDGQPKYSGRHALRHFYASWCINPRERGGLGLPAKVVQQLLGHSSIVMTMDTYGHLFPANDDVHARLAECAGAPLDAT
jgi:integrase